VIFEDEDGRKRVTENEERVSIQGDSTENKNSDAKDNSL